MEFLGHVCRRRGLEFLSFFSLCLSYSKRRPGLVNYVSIRILNVSFNDSFFNFVSLGHNYNIYLIYIG